MAGPPSAPTNGTWKLWRGWPAEKPLFGSLQSPPELEQLGDDAGAGRVALGRGQVVEAAYAVVGDAFLDLRGGPPTGDDGRTHPHREGALSLEVL